jgi:hypothetical protein
MSKAANILVAWVIILVSLTVILAGCSGGGGGSAKSGNLVDPSSSFKGSTTKAVPAAENAEDLAMGGFNCTSIATSIHGVAKASGSNTTKVTGNRPVLAAAQILKQSVRRMRLPQKATLLRKQPTAAFVPNNIVRTSTYQLQGDSGGTASYSLETNDLTGSFFGTIVFQSFASGGVVVDGTADVLGTFDVNRQEFSRFTLSFRSLTFSSDGFTVSLTGSLSWGFNFSSNTETLSMNMVLLDQTTGKTYWYNNYELVTVYSGSILTQTISGRYYDHNNGYVDITTLTPLVTDYGNQWPSEGSLAFTGDLGRWVRLNFHANTLVIEADTNSDGSSDWQVERSSNVTPPINTAPTANAGLDQNVTQFTTVHLDGSASSDMEGDPLSYTWSYVSGPGYLALTGANTATPSFTANITGTYVYSLTVYDGNSTSQPDTVTVVVAPTAPTDPAFVKQQWQYGMYGTFIGQVGLFTADLDGDGTVEIIASATTGGYESLQWYVIRRTANGSYEQVWRSPFYGVGIIRMVLTDMNDDGKADVVVAFTDGTIRIYDGPTLKEIRTLKIAASQKDIAIADLDGDGIKEIVSSDGLGVSVYNGQTGVLKWSIASGGGTSIAVGNVDSDPVQEIVTTTYGGKGYVLNGLTGEVKWAYVNSFGAKVKLADLDGDGMQEIIGASSWAKITIFDADLKSPTWEIATTQDIGALTVTDADGDGVPEIIYGDGQWGKVHAVDVHTRTDKWSVSNPVNGISGITMGDVDQDGKMELLWGAGGSDSGPDFLFIADPITGTIKWKNLDFSGLRPLAVGDVNDDGEDEIVMVTNFSNSGYDEGIIHIFNARTHELKFQQKLGTSDWTGNDRAVRIGDVDGDGHTEFVVTSSDLYNGLILVYDGATGTLKQKSDKYSNSTFTALAIGDVDNDGKLEIVAGGGGQGQGMHIVVFDGTTLQEKWRSVDLSVYSSPVYDIKIADLDKDGHPDIIATMTDNRLVVFDGVTHVLKLMIDSPARAIEVADVDGDGFLEILVGRYDGKIDVYDGVTFAIKKTVPTFGMYPIDALRVADLDGNGTKEWLIASYGVLSILDEQGLKWRSSNLGSSLGKNNSIAVKDVDGDGRQDIFIGSDQVLYQFE